MAIVQIQDQAFQTMTMQLRLMQICELSFYSSSVAPSYDTVVLRKTVREPHAPSILLNK